MTAVQDQQVSYWNAYYAVLGELVASYDEMSRQFPSFFTHPQEIHVRVARDGIAVTHTESDAWSLRCDEGEVDLQEVVGQIVQVPIPAPDDLDLWLGGGPDGRPSLQVVDAITGEVVARTESQWDRLDVVGTMRSARWDPIHARVAAQRDFASARAQLIALSLGATRVVERLRDQVDRFVELLAPDPPEQVVQEFLESWPMLLAPAAASVIPKLQFGSEYVTDFVVAEAKGEYLLVELEAPGRQLFTRSGRPRAGLTHAIQQVRDWRAWVREHSEYARSILPGVTEPHGIVVIGRHTALSDQDRRRLQHLNAEEVRLKVKTYDDLIAQATQFADNLESVARMGGGPILPRPEARRRRASSTSIEA